MPHEELDRSALRFKPLSARRDRVYIERDHVSGVAPQRELPDRARAVIEETADRLCAARAAGKARMLVFGAHAIKNGLGPVLIRLMEEGWVTHLATNGAGVIHDWEFAWQGHSSEHVQENVARGEFGAWEETGYFINLAINLGAWGGGEGVGLGYGEAVGALIEREGLEIPSAEMLRDSIAEALEAGQPGKAASAADLLGMVQRFNLQRGWMPVPHPFKRYSAQAAAYRCGVPFTAHPMFGHDIIYLHPMSCGAAIGRAAERDFLRFAHSVTQLDGGVYMSIGSAVMSPMVFEKSMSMAQNLAIQAGRHIDKHLMVVVDLQESHWDWTQGEPPEDNPDYYLRFNKSFSRMGGTLRYCSLDNRDFLLGLLAVLNKV